MVDGVRDPLGNAQSVAIIGMSGRLPGALDLDGFWRALVAGAEGITRFTDKELADAGVPTGLLSDPAYVRAAGVLSDPGHFDAAFFDVTPAEAEQTDPQHRLLLECAWQALEHAGYVPQRFGGRIGVFASASTSGYRYERIAAGTSHPMQVAIGNDPDMLATRLSYKLDLTGPSVTVQTACSSSLVAVHLACQSLLIHESDIALAGGAAVRMLEPTGYPYEEGGISSPDGRCRPFDAGATGTVPGDGVGVVVLKRLDDAVADGDHIHAVILGSAINNDGAAKAGFTAPSPAGQTAVIAEALAVAGVDPSTIQYIEAHGTATRLGDPIEVRALAEAYGTGPAPRLLGSVKSNLGHLDTAAGVASLLKAVLAIEHRFIPPTLHFTTANPEAGLDRATFRVNREGEEWPAASHPPRAGVSSFGVGGTNVHLVLEGAPDRPAAGARRPWSVMPVSARTPTALDTLTAGLAGHLRTHPEAALADVAYTLQVGRAGFEYRRAVVCRDRDGAVAALAAAEGRRPVAAPADPPPVVFMFPGQGSQYPGMGAELYEREPAFREAMDECAGLLLAELGWDVREVTFARHRGANGRLVQTLYTQPAIFAIDYALARLLMGWGVRPDAMIGHSLGELVAACLAGVFTLADAVRVVATRARLMQELPAGQMLSVPLDETTLLRTLDGHGEIAAVNAPGACVVAGTGEEIIEVRRRLEQLNLTAPELATSHAFHSRHVEPALAGLATVVRDLPLGKPRVAFVSNLSGTWITDQQATDPDYWVSITRRPVRFSQGIATLLGAGGAVLAEVGPGSVLSGLARLHREPGSDQRPTVVTVLPRPRAGRHDECRSVLDALAGLWQHGAAVDWPALHRGERRRRVPLPTYPFERAKYLLPRQGQRAAPDPPSRRDPTGWCYVPAWHVSPCSAGPEPTEPTSWLVFEDDRGLAGQLAAALRARGGNVTTVRPHRGYARTAQDAFLINPDQPDHIRRLVRDLHQDSRPPERVVHAWSVKAGVGGSAGDRFESAQSLGFGSLVQLAQALNDAGGAGTVRVDVLTDRLHSVHGEAVRAPERATVLGAATVLTQEFPALEVRCVDVVVTEDGGLQRLVEQLLIELTRTQPDRLTAYREGRRWSRGFAPVQLAPAPAGTCWRAGAPYLVSGASGQGGLTFAEHMAESGARLALVGDPGFVARERWTEWCATHPAGDRARQHIERLMALEAAYPDDVVYLTADLADPAQARDAVERARKRWGSLRGAVHAVDVRGSGLAALKSTDQWAAVLAARVRSTLLLDELLRDDDLDFLLLVSATTGVVGGFGQLENTAAAAFLDAFAHARTMGGSGPVAIDYGLWEWDDWHEQQAAEMPSLREHYQRLRRDHGIPVREGISATQSILASGLPQVIVSTIDFQEVLAGQAMLTPSAAVESLAADRAAEGATQVWDPMAAWPDDEVARRVASVWHEVLGVTDFGPEDDFFELGGNSLFAIQIVSRLRQLYGDLPMSVLFEASTVPEVAAAIRARQGEVIGLAEFDALLREVESLAPEQARARLEGDDA